MAGTFNVRIFHLQFLYMRGGSSLCETTMPGTHDCFALPASLCLSYRPTQVYHILTQTVYSHSCYCTAGNCTIETYKLLKHKVVEIWMHCDQDG
jgi:hypothetical protein